jgi:archaellum biogenesis ATPase FlaH
MVKQELIERSPVRFLEKSANGGLAAGEIGVLTSKKGLGKTSVLVQIGLDMLLQEKAVVHVSFNQHSDNVITWYEDIFSETAKKKNLADAEDVKNSVIRNRVILNFSPDTVSAERIINTLKALVQGGIDASCLIIDGLDLSVLKSDDFNALKSYGKEANLVIWFSQNVDNDDAYDNPDVDCVIHLAQKTDTIQMMILKSHGTACDTASLKLDSKTLLMSEK